MFNNTFDINHSTNSYVNADPNTPICEIHKKEIEFICLSHMCYKELCGHCILEHSEHISFIKGIKNVLEDVAIKISNISPKKMEND